MKELINKLIKLKDLSVKEAYTAMSEIMEGNVSKSLMAAFLVALKIKKESVDEISGFAQAMLDKANRVVTDSEVLVDTCGTGGDNLGTFNISTTAAFIAAGAGVKIAKHGNRSVSSRCGSADVLETCGVKLDLDTNEIAECIDEIGIGFIFAPVAHVAMKYVAEVRKELGVRTVFNILGPITNPAKASRRVLGVYDNDLLNILPGVLKNIGVMKAFLLNSRNGMDELSTTAESDIVYLDNDKITRTMFRPQEYGFRLSVPEELRGGDNKLNAKIMKDILSGKLKDAMRDTAVINAAAAIMVGELAEDFGEAIKIAENSIENGKAFEKLQSLVDISNNF